MVFRKRWVQRKLDMAGASRDIASVCQAIAVGIQRLGDQAERSFFTDVLPAP
jgi:hypothetical protein